VSAPSRPRPHRHSWSVAPARFDQDAPGLHVCECGAFLDADGINALEDKARNLDALLRQVGEPGTCRGCAAPIYWVVHLNGKRAPYTPEGLNHFADCPAQAQFRRETPRRQI
jgi:hypothetical protein